MLAYATVDDYKRMKQVTVGFSANGDRNVRDYLARATQYIDATTRRRFFPFRQTRMYGVPTVYADLRNRGMIYDDLLLGYDLLEAFDIRTSQGAVASTTTLTAPVTASATSISVADATGIAAYTLLMIDNEIISVVSVSGTTLRVERAQHQTRASAYASGVTVSLLAYHVLTPGMDYFTLAMNVYPKYGLRLTYPNSWAGPYSGGRWLWREPQVFVTALWGYNERYADGAWIDTLQTLSDAVGVSDATITVTDVDDTPDAGGSTPAFEAGYLIRIEDELMWVQSVDDSAESVGVRRGVHGTIAQAHDAGLPITRWAVHEEIREACLVIAKTWKDADDSVGGRQGVSDISTGVQIAMPADITAILRRYVRPPIL